MRKYLRLAVIGIASLLVMQASAAFAAADQWSWVDVTLQTEQQQPMLLVAGTLPEKAKLPYEGELAVPTGTQIQWVGEILGGDASKDPTMQYTKVSSANGMDIYRFTLTKSRTAQIEGLLMGSVGSTGSQYTANVKWVAPNAVPEVRMNARIPASAKIVQPSEGAAIQSGDSGFSYYSKTVKDVKPGQPVDLAFAYEIGAATGAAGTGTATTGGDSPAVILIILGCLAGFVALAYGVQRKMAAKNQDAEDLEVAAYPGADEVRPGKSVPVKTASDASAKSQSAKANTGASVSVAEAEDEPATRKKSPVVPALIVIAVFIAGFLIAGRMGTTPAARDGKITRSFGSASACQSSSLVLAPTEGVDLAKQGEAVINAFQGMEGIGSVTLDTATGAMEVGWCESSQTEASVAQALAATGLVTVASQSSAPAAPSAQ